MPELKSFVTYDPQRRGGRACVRDLRIGVGDVLGWLAEGMTPEQVIADYPELTRHSRLPGPCCRLRVARTACACRGVKLLHDENLPRRLVPALQDCHPGSSQVALLGLERATDAALCEFAADCGFAPCSKDDDFLRLVAARGYRPKLVHLAPGNASNESVLAVQLSARASECCPGRR